MLSPNLNLHIRCVHFMLLLKTNLSIVYRYKERGFHFQKPIVVLYYCLLLYNYWLTLTSHVTLDWFSVPLAGTSENAEIC